MEVHIGELKEIIDTVFETLRSRGVDRVDIPHDFYWSIPGLRRYSPYEEPRELTMGQLSDDMHELRRIHADDAPVTCYALVWAAAVLRAIGETTVE